MQPAVFRSHDTRQVNHVATERLEYPESGIDVVTLEIIQSALVAGCEEMAEAMMRTAYSPGSPWMATS